GAQDNGTHFYNAVGINSTVEVTGGDGAFCHIDTDNPNIQISSYVYNNYWITNNGWTTRSQYFYSNTGAFINPTDYDSDANILYGAHNNDTYFQVSNVGLGTPVDNTVTVTQFGGDRASTVSVSVNTANRVFFGTTGGRVVRVDNAHTATPTATHINNGAGMPGGNVSSIAIEEGDDNHLVVTYSNYGVNSVWETTNGGTTWTSKEGDLPDMPIRWALFVPNDANQVLLATELGVWSTDDISAAVIDWDPSNNGLANVRVDMLQGRNDGQVIAATHGRGLYSTDAFALPVVQYVAASSTQTEAGSSGVEGNCRAYVDLIVELEIDQAPPVNVDLTIGVDAGSAATADDYSFPNGTAVSFPAGATANQPFTVRVFDDGLVEGDENLDLNFTFNATGQARSGTNAMHSLSIEDDNGLPEVNGGQTAVNILTEDFEAGALPAGWSLDQATAGSDEYQFGTNAALSSANFTIPANGSLVAASNDDNCNCDKSEDRLNLPAQDLSAFVSASLQYDAYFQGDTYQGNTESAFVEISIDGGTTWDQYAIPAAGTWNTYTLDLSSYAGNNNVLISFRYNDGNGWLYGVALDNIQLDGLQGTPAGVEDVLNEADTHEVGPFETVFFYNDDQDIIAKIENLSGHDYGCTTVQIDRAGTGTVDFWDALDNSVDLAEKTYLVTPTNNNPSGSYTITLYYTQAEVNGWEAITGKTWLADAKMVKNPAAISNVTPGNNYPNGPNIEIVVDNASALGGGNDFEISASFATGFSGFGVGDPSPPQVLPANLLAFTAEARETDISIDWVSVQEYALSGYELEKSVDGHSYRPIEWQEAKGINGALASYQHLDRDPINGRQFYRLRMVDQDGVENYSPVVEVNWFGNESFLIGPSPFTDRIWLNSQNSMQSLSLVDANGRLILEKELSPTQRQTYNWRIYKSLSSGIYFVRVRFQDGSQKMLKILHQ
ncbi:MAG: T9SS type A sorting domain-containing protein, partial [Bacteroidota bacterium]